MTNVPSVSSYEETSSTLEKTWRGPDSRTWDEVSVGRSRVWVRGVSHVCPLPEPVLVPPTQPSLPSPLSCRTDQPKQGGANPARPRGEAQPSLSATQPSYVTSWLSAASPNSKNNFGSLDEPCLGHSQLRAELWGASLGERWLPPPRPAGLTGFCFRVAFWDGRVSSRRACS